MNKMIKKIMNNLQRIMEVVAVVIVLGLVILMFTGKVGTIISLTVFSVLIIAANMPMGKKMKNNGENKVESSREVNSQKEKMGTGIGRVA